MELGVTVDESALVEWGRRLEAGLDPTGPGPVQSGLRAASARLMGFERQRFVSLSAGGGEWPDLALSTKIRRMQKSGGGLKPVYAARLATARKTKPGTTQAQMAASLHFDILRDTGQLLNSLSVGAPGHFESITKDGITVGSAVAYAHFHQSPLTPGKPPQRTIIAPPDAQTASAIDAILRKAVQSVIESIQL